MKIKNGFKYYKATIKHKDGQIYQNIESFIWHCADASERGLEDLSISDCKLQLRQLSSLTEEERKEIKKIQYGDDGVVFDIDMLVDPTRTQYSDEMYESEINVIDYLRSINIDIDNLIESGEAEVCEK
jgi:hypothetical protein